MSTEAVQLNLGIAQTLEGGVPRTIVLPFQFDGNYWRLELVLAAGSAAIGVVDTELPAAAALGDGKAIPTAPATASWLVGFNGNTGDLLRVADTQRDLSTIAAGSIATVWTPSSGKKIRLMGGTISVSAACSVLFEDNSVNNFVFRTSKLLADTPYNFVVSGGQGKLLSAANNVLKITSSVAANVTGTIWGTEEST